MSWRRNHYLPRYCSPGQWSPSLTALTVAEREQKRLEKQREKSRRRTQYRLQKKHRKRSQNLADKRRLERQQAKDHTEVGTAVAHRREYLPVTTFPLDSQETGMQIAEALSERDPRVLLKIVAMVDAFGGKKIQAFLDDAMRVQDAGGELTDDGSRWRTLGGVFFRIAKDNIGVPMKRLKIWVLKDCSD